MIFITGDTHIPIDIHKLSTQKFPMQRELTKEDIVIICGDFGGVWNNSKQDQHWLKWLDERNFTTVFVDGNHENFDLLNTYEVVDFCGGKAHKINNSVYHLMRGEVFTFEGETFFVMGGAASHDKIYRKEGKSWWPQEMPNQEEYDNAINNLEKHNYSVDYILSHCAASNVQDMFAPFYKKNELTQFLKMIHETVEYKRWFFGHYHINREITDKDTAIYDHILRLK